MDKRHVCAFCHTPIDDEHWVAFPFFGDRVRTHDDCSASMHAVLMLTSDGRASMLEQHARPR